MSIKRASTTALQVSLDGGSTWGTLRSQSGVFTAETQDGHKVLDWLGGERQRWQQNYYKFAGAAFRVAYLDRDGRAVS